MFAVVRTGGKQYRVAAGDKIAVEKLAGEAGETITLGDVLIAGNGDSLLDAAQTTVSAEIIAQAKGEKVVVFKKRRRHNYRRKNGHRQQLTLLRIVAVGDDRYEAAAKPAVTETAEAPAATAPAVENAAPVTDVSSEEAGNAALADVQTAGEVAAPKAKKAAPKKTGAAAKPAADDQQG